MWVDVKQLTKQSLMDPLSDANFNTCCNIYNIKTNMIYQDSLSSYKKKKIIILSMQYIFLTQVG